MQGTLSDADAQALILLEIADADGIVAPYIAKLWALYSDVANIPRLRYLYALKKAIEIMQGSVRQKITFEITGDVRVELAQKMANLETMRRAVLEETRIVEERAKRSRDPVVDQLSTISPIAPPHGWLADANSADYSGNPYPRLPSGATR